MTGDKDLQGELINIYITNDMLGKAVVDLKTLVDADTTNTNNMLNLAILYDNQGNKEMALATYVKVLEIDPFNYDCNFNMAVFHFNEAVKIKQQVDAMTMAGRCFSRILEFYSCTWMDGWMDGWMDTIHYSSVE